MKTKFHFKKIVAREILILFVCLIFLVLTLIVLTLRDNYYKNKSIRMSNKIEIINELIYDQSSIEILKKIYNRFSPHFIEKYSINNKVLRIPKSKEKRFLSVYPQAEHLSEHPTGYSYRIINKVILKNDTVKYRDLDDLGKSIKKIFDEYSDVDNTKLGEAILAKYRSKIDSIVIFDYINYNQFKQQMGNDIYRLNFYNSYSDSIVLGKYSNYNANIINSINNSNNEQTSIDSLKTELYKARSKEQNYQSIINNNDNYNIIIFLSILVLIIIFLFRYLYYIIHWALLTIKTNEKQ